MTKRSSRPGPAENDESSELPPTTVIGVVPESLAAQELDGGGVPRCHSLDQ